MRVDQHNNHLVTWARSHYFGKYRGLVTDNADSTNRGRLKVKVPAVLGDLEVWAMPSFPYADAGDDGIGFYSLPEPGTGVWIEHEQGDPSYPIWTGCFPGKGLPKNESGTEASPPLKIFRTKKGMLLAFDDDKQTISLSDDQGNNILKMDIPNGLIKIQSTAKVVVEAPQIELIKDSTHPIVFGDDLLQYLNQLVTMFNSHLHPGELAMGVFPVTPMVPAVPWTPPDPSMLSLKVKSG